MPKKKGNLTLARCFIVLLFSILFLPPQISIAQETVTALMPPQNLNAQPQPEKGKVTLSWSPVSGAAGYNIYRKLAGDAAYSRVNFSSVKANSYDDTTVVKGKSYDYVVRAVDAAGNESSDSRIVGAPNMVMEESAEILHEGQLVKLAMPGDAITYIIDYANTGYGIAKDVSIVHAIPKGTTLLSGTAKSETKANVNISYFDEKKADWVEEIKNEEDISKIMFEILDDIPPIAKGKNGTVSFKVSVKY